MTFLRRLRLSSPATALDTEAPDEPGVRLRDVHLTRAERMVFDSLTLRLTERRIGLVGDNGSGKSSLLRL